MTSKETASVSGFVGRWMVSIEKDKQGEKVVKIYDTKFHDDRFQFVSSYFLHTFLTVHNTNLILDGSNSDWVMTQAEVYQAQEFAYKNQFLLGDVKMAEHINGGIIG
jgi:hypothetical protein